METGQMVVLLNLQNLYESLYDALNQYYVYLAGQKYVDLGLGTHRVKCRVHPKFRLIVIEEKDVVYKHFPIPLINRLEKHYLDISTVLDKGQRETVKELKKWAHEFAAANTEEHFVSQQRYSPSDVFVGYHPTTCASVVLQTTERLRPACCPSELLRCVKREAQLALLNCATPDAVIRLCNSVGLFMADSLANIYFKQQQHTSFADFLRAHVRAGAGYQTVFTEVTTFSRLLTSADAACLEREVRGKAQRPQILFLQQFDTEYSFLKGIRDFLDATTGNKILIIQTDFEDGSQNAQLIASAKYTVVNEINRVDLGEVSVFVYFIMKLSRVEGGSSYVGFHGGLWQSVHIDDLRRSKDMISDMTALQNLTISQMFCEDSGKTKGELRAGCASGEKGRCSPRLGAGTATFAWYNVSGYFPCSASAEILDTTVLLRTCVQSAVGMLRDQNEDLSRSRKRIKILLGLLSKEDDLKASFLKITKARLANLLKKQEENSLHPKNWVLREASNLSALQEAGTFRHTLWKRVQKVITPFLALLIAVIDRNGNLELLVRPAAEWVTNLWMFIFSDTKLLTVPSGVGANSSQPEIILVQNNMTVSADVGNEMPFSWRIKEYLDELWLEAQYIQNAEGENQAEKFVDIFQKTALGKFLSALSEEERHMLFQCYTTDFIVLTIGVSSLEELAFLSCIEEWKAASPRREETVPSLPWVHLGYSQFKSRLQNFSRILAVHPRVVDYLVNQEGDGIPHSEMVLDVLAAMVCAEELENQVQTAHPETWLQKVKNLRMPIEFLCKEKDLQRTGKVRGVRRVCWDRVFSMSLFVEHVLLGINTLMPEFENLVKKYTLLLANCFQHNSDMKTHTTFVAMMKVLCQCKDEVSHRHGLKSCPVCLGEPRDPVCLPCCHVFCQKCIRTWLVPAQMHCPYCKVAVGDVDLDVSVELRDAIAKGALFRQRCNNFFIDVVTTMCFKDNEPPEAEVILELLNLLFVHRSLLQGSDQPAIYTKFLSPFNDEVDETPIIRSVMLKLLLKYRVLRSLVGSIMLVLLLLNMCFQQTDAMTTFIQDSQVLNSPELQHFAASLVMNTLPSLTVDPQSFSPSGALIEMAVHTAAVLLCGQSPVLQPLRNLAFCPHTMEHSFLPTMPEDIMAQARAWKGVCGLPMETSRCLDCGAQVGGMMHIPLHGFQEFRNEDRTQTGHILGDAQHRKTTGVSDRAMSPVVFVLIRLLTHLTMLLGATKDPQSLQKIIKPPVHNSVSFLQQHIREDLAQLTKILGKSVDETINILHLVLGSLLKDPHQHPGQFQFDGVLSTKEKRNKWEEIVANTIIIPELEDLDKKLLKLNRQIQEDERISSNPIVKIVYGDPGTFLPQLPKGSHIHHSKMWSCRKRISVENLGHVVQQKNARDTVPLLWKFLQKETELRLVKFLPEILALQKDLVRRFQNTADVKHCSIRYFLNEPLSDVMRDLFQKRVNVFLTVWNKLRSSLDTSGEIKLPEGYCDADLTLDSQLEVLLPRRQGLGLCSTALASYLISLHNDFIHSVNKHIKEDDRYLISPSEVADLHLISYEVERDLIPLILSNCQYSMERGGQTLQDFDLERIQQQVISKFLQGKPLITLTGIPTLVYRHDRNYEQLFNDVRNKLDQSALPTSVMNMISGELQSYSDVCDALSVTEITLGFLAMAGENAEMLLTDYIENVLQMGDQTNPHVLQALRRCHLKHNIALWQLLSTRKSEQLLRLKRDPFVDINTVYKAELSPEIAKLLNTFLVHSRLETFLQELHEMIVLKLRRVQAVDEFRPTWSLKESLIPYLDVKDSELATELQEMFPDEILLSHATATWKAAALFKRERREG
uniref:Ring finger protein 213 n=1 Tax=Bubo bubo TaxID=30461 RepID=A0A8C0FV13_BUBBB